MENVGQKGLDIDNRSFSDEVTMEVEFKLYRVSAMTQDVQ